MAHLLDGCWAKIERASESITNLESEIQRWAQSDPPPHRIVRGLDHKKRAYTFTAFCSPVPLRISVLAGEIVHHLRFGNTDKHKLLLLVTNVVTMGDKITVDSGETDANQTNIIGMSPPPESLGLTATESGTEVFSILLGNYTPKFRATLHFTLQLSFEEFGNKKNAAIVSGLAQLRDAAKGAIERFRGEF